MRKVLVVFLATMLWFNLSSQDFEYKIGTEWSGIKPEHGHYWNFKGIDGSLYSLYRTLDWDESKELALVKYNSDLKHQFTAKIKKGPLDYFIAAREDGSSIFVYLHRTNKSRSLNQIVGIELDLKGNTKNEKIIDDITFKNKYNSSCIGVTSEDGSKTAIIFETFDIKNEKNITTVYVKDAQSKSVSKKSFNIGSQGQRLSAAEISNSGTIFFVLDGSDDSPSQNILYRIDANLTESKKVKMDVKEVKPWNVCLEFDEERKELTAAGTVAVNYSSISGFFVSKFSQQTLEQKTFDVHPVDRKFLEFFNPDMKDSKESINFLGRYEAKIKLTSKGAGYVVFEHIKAAAHETDLGAMYFNGSGEIKQTWLLSKTADLNFLVQGYHMLIKGNSLVLLYNDDLSNTKNTNMKEAKKTKASLKSTGISAIQLNPTDGSLKKSFLFKSQEINGYIIPEQDWSRKNELVVFISNGKNHKLISIKNK